MSICGPMVLTPLITYIKPDNFDWEIFKQIKSDVGTLEDLQSRRHHDTTTTAPIEEEEKAHDDERHDQEINARLLVARKKAGICCVVLCLSFCILWPIPMYATDYGKFFSSFHFGHCALLSAYTYYYCPFHQPSLSSTGPDKRKIPLPDYKSRQPATL